MYLGKGNNNNNNSNNGNINIIIIIIIIAKNNKKIRRRMKNLGKNVRMTHVHPATESPAIP